MPKTNGSAPTTGRYLGLLLLGLFPLVGLVCCLKWAYGEWTPPTRRNLARAMLWLHGAVLVLVITGLAIWVAWLAGVRLPFLQ